MAVKFLDGPAEGSVLQLRRAPMLLRVVIDTKTGEVDALDQLSDGPRQREAIHVYRLVGEAQMVHICRRPTGSGWTAYADYRLNNVQPDDATARDMAAWREWAMSQPDNRVAQATPKNKD